jgi:hypothetical protein
VESSKHSSKLVPGLGRRVGEKLRMPSHARQMTLVTDWQFKLQDKPTLSISLKPSDGICETVTITVWRASLGEERHFIAPPNL